MDELEPIDNVALVCCKEEATSLDSLARGGLSCGDFWTELDTATNDASVVSGYGGGEVFEVGSRIGLPGVRCEGASVLRIVLRFRVARKGIAEIVITGCILPEDRIVLGWRDINGSSCSPESESAVKASVRMGARATYRSSNDPSSGLRGARCRVQELNQGLDSV